MTHKKTHQINKYLKNIDQQIDFNKGKNIFLDNDDLKLKFIEDTISVISNIKELTVDSEKVLIEYATEKAIEEFCRINQYYSFNNEAKNELRHVYSILFSSIKTNEKSIELISKEHYERLKQWLGKTNPFAEKIYSNAEPNISPVACSEYSVELQIAILNVDTQEIMEPFLDIGCGKQGNLVNYLGKLGIDSTGIDRLSFSDNNLINSDWLEYHFGLEKWGTIVSNLGFSNHFKHHNLREDGDYIEYAKKYMDILKSLKIGGRFHYAPDIPFIEMYLDRNQFQINKYRIGEFDFETTVITRLK